MTFYECERGRGVFLLRLLVVFCSVCVYRRGRERGGCECLSFTPGFMKYGSNFMGGAALSVVRLYGAFGVLLNPSMWVTKQRLLRNVFKALALQGYHQYGYVILQNLHDFWN